MIQSREEKKDSLLQALLQEYANAAQLYTNTIAVTYTRFYGFLAVHGALTVGFFLISGQWLRLAISVIGLILAILTFLSIEHVWQFSVFRLTQAREIEKRLNQLIKADNETKLTTFNNQEILFIKKENVRFPLTEVTLPEICWGAWLIKHIPYQAERMATGFIIGWWIFLIFLSCFLN